MKVWLCGLLALVNAASCIDSIMRAQWDFAAFSGLAALGASFVAFDTWSVDRAE